MIDIAFRVVATFACSVAWLWLACVVASVAIEALLREPLRSSTKAAVVAWALAVIVGSAALVGAGVVNVWGSP